MYISRFYNQTPIACHIFPDWRVSTWACLILRVSAASKPSLVIKGWTVVDPVVRLCLLDPNNRVRDIITTVLDQHTGSAVRTSLVRILPHEWLSLILRSRDFCRQPRSTPTRRWGWYPMPKEEKHAADREEDIFHPGRSDLETSPSCFRRRNDSIHHQRVDDGNDDEDHIRIQREDQSLPSVREASGNQRSRMDLLDGIYRRNREWWLGRGGQPDVTIFLQGNVQIFLYSMLSIW